MIDGVGVYGLDHGDVIDVFRGERQQFADPRSALAMLRKLELRRSNRQS